MPTLGNFELPEPEAVKTACDVCKALNPHVETPKRGFLEGKPEHESTRESARCWVSQDNACIESTRAQLLLTYFQLMQAQKKES